MSSNPIIAAVFALFLWWFSTGAILWVVRRADGADAYGHGWTALLSLPVLFAGIIGVRASLETGGAGGAYMGFVSALAVWGWIELVFLTGLVTGPNRAACPPAVSEGERFRRAWGTVAYHELLLAAALLVLVAASRGAETTVAAWTFAVLFGARISAKLNLFLGVPRIHTEFLPRPLLHLPSHMRVRRQSWLFPISVTALTLALGHFWMRLAESGDVAAALLATLTALALLEHWLMVLPLPDEKLWRWMLPAPKDTTTAKVRTTP